MRGPLSHLMEGTRNRHGIAARHGAWYFDFGISVGPFANVINLDVVMRTRNAVARRSNQAKNANNAAEKPHCLRLCRLQAGSLKTARCPAPLRWPGPGRRRRGQRR